MEELKKFLQNCTDEKNVPAADPAHIGNILHQVLDCMAAQSVCADQAFRFNTGIEEIDRVTGGLRLGELVVINGDQGSGKTSLALHYAIHAVEKHHKPVWIFTRTHSAHQITKRILSMLTGVPIWSIEEGWLKDVQWQSIMTAAVWLKQHDIRIYDTCMSLKEVREKVLVRGKPALLIIDGEEAWELNEKQIQKLGILAKEKQCCVLFTDCKCSNTAFIKGNVDKELWLRRMHGDVYFLELSWNRHGKLGECDLHRTDETLSFFA